MISIKFISNAEPGVDQVNWGLILLWVMKNSLCKHDKGTAREIVCGKVQYYVVTNLRR